MNRIKVLFFDFKNDKYKVLFFFILVFLTIFSVCSLQPKIAGDSLLYTESIEVIKTGIEPDGFIPMMILTTPLGLVLIMFFDLLFNNIAISWVVLDAILYIVTGLFFYSLSKRIFSNSWVAFWGGVILMTNYAAVAFGMGYLMDMGGWLAYMASIYFSYRYLESEQKENKWLYFSSVSIGIGGLYKEYAFVAFVILFGVLVQTYWGKWRDLIIKTIIVGCLAFTPFILMNFYTFFTYNGYTYLDWFGHQRVYEYQNRLVEFIKSFGSIYNFGWFLFLPGFYLFIKKHKEVIRDKNLLFILLVILSSFAVLLWPVVTRVLFITMPAVVLISSIFIQKMEKRFYFLLPIIFAYILSGFLMDAYILDFVNLPI